MLTSGQDGGRGRYTVLPHTPKTRTTTVLEMNNDQNCLKSELYGNLTTKELQKQHSPRTVEVKETCSRGGKDWQQGSGCRRRVSR